jgi:hypothetical protein
VDDDDLARNWKRFRERVNSSAGDREIGTQGTLGKKQNKGETQPRSHVVHYSGRSS